jgi:hypothetical protein
MCISAGILKTPGPFATRSAMAGILVEEQNLLAKYMTWLWLAPGWEDSLQRISITMKDRMRKFYSLTIMPILAVTPNAMN